MQTTNDLYYESLLRNSYAYSPQLKLVQQDSSTDGVYFPTQIIKPIKFKSNPKQKLQELQLNNYLQNNVNDSTNNNTNQYSSNLKYYFNDHHQRHYRHEMDKLSNTTSFPPSFNPRDTPNMPHKEKVNKWLDNVPIYYADESWFNDCYPAVNSLNQDNEIDNDELIWNMNEMNELIDKDDLIEFQSRIITRFAKDLYKLEDEDCNNSGDAQNYIDFDQDDNDPVEHLEFHTNYQNIGGNNYDYYDGYNQQEKEVQEKDHEREEGDDEDESLKFKSIKRPGHL
ncbi:hypothetical protein WICMUC_000437 [Wickerhamomyces mucosus]|uniref:Uncharacterized protein n=1 Tax=Wickerhamomyces mucosus TaxID=1378264 RepID=A0A9P8TJ48_9ASCO|nr:hypothetical protein WICMUC_000437 [Wickerhamomyces mucosus]